MDLSLLSSLLIWQDPKPLKPSTAILLALCWIVIIVLGKGHRVEYDAPDFSAKKFNWG